MTGAALIGWALVPALAALLLAARRRLALVADAEHELRGALTSLGLAVEAGAGRGAYTADLERARAGLQRLARARGRRAAAGAGAPQLALGPVVAQVLANLVGNAVEHGGGELLVRSRREGGAIALEVADRGPGFRPGQARRTSGGRGRGLGIVRRAVRDAGGSLSIQSGDHGSVVAVELPLADPAA